MHDTTYDKYNGASSSGKTSNNYSRSNIYVKVNSTLYYTKYYLSTTVHELFHAYDYGFYQYFGGPINNNPDVSNLFKKYS